MKITHQTIKIANILGHCADDVIFPDNTKGSIEFDFEYNQEFEILSVVNGYLYVGKNTTLKFSRSVTSFHSTHLGPKVEGFSVLDFTMEYISEFSGKLRNVEVDVKLNNL